MPGATSPDLSVFDAAPVRARRRRSPRGGGGGWGRWSTLILAVAVLGGCTAQAEEPVPPPVTTSAEPTVEPSTTEAEPEPEPEPTGLVRPEAMDRNDDAGAIVAAEYLTVLAFDVVTSLDLAEWSLVSGDSCDFCASTVQMIEQTVAEGHTYEGGSAEVIGEPVIVGRDETLGVLGIDVPIAINAASEVNAEGAVLQSWEAATGFFYVELAFGYQGWTLMSAHTHTEAY